MAFYDQDDQLSNRQPHQMQVLVNTIAAIGEDNVPMRGFIASHLAQQEGEPAILLSLWVASEYFDEEEENEGQEFNLDGWTLAYTFPTSPQQARALAFALLRLADGLEVEVERGLYGQNKIGDYSVYFSDPRL